MGTAIRPTDRLPLGLIILLGVLSGMAAVSTNLYLPATPSVTEALEAGRAEIVLLLLAELPATISMFTFITGSALIIIGHYGMSPQSFGFLFSLMISGSLMGTFANTRLASMIKITSLIWIGLIIGIAGAGLLLGSAAFKPEDHTWFLGALWIALIPNAAMRSNYAALGFQYLPERTGTVSAIFGAFSRA